MDETLGPPPQKPPLSFLQIWNMSFGFLGIQFGFALQNANVSRIFETLGAATEELALFWLAAPVTGLLVQPIIGYLSDQTWHPRLGRRRPYFLIGAILATLGLFAMPNSPTLWVAVGMLWIMDASINVSMEPFRAFVGDMLPSEQRTTGFATQSFFIGVGAVVASILPWVLTNWLGVSNTAPANQIPASVRWSFYLGGFAFFGAVFWTVISTREYPPHDMEAFLRKKRRTTLLSGVKETVLGLREMPVTMKQLAVVQFFSWFALFSMWIYTTPAVTRHVFGSGDPTTPEYNQGADWVGICFAVYNGIAALAAFLLPVLARKTSRKTTHMIGLLAGSMGLVSIYFIREPIWLLGAMLGIGIAWASILSMPYAMLAGALPGDRMGYFMGVFNFFIVIPQIVAAGILGYLLRSFFANDPIYALVCGGIAMGIAAVSVTVVRDVDESAGARNRW